MSRRAGVPTVVHSVHARAATINQYVPLLLGSVPDEVVTLPFSWRRAIFTRYDLFHLHWPEGLTRGATIPRDVTKKLLAGALIVRLYLTGTPIVRTVHNTTPHEAASAVERLQTRLLDRRTVTWIRLNPYTPLPRRGHVVTIPHGHYRDWFTRRRPAPPGERRTLLFFGHIRPYKGCEGLIRAFRDLDRRRVGLRLVGRSSDDDLRTRIQDLAARDDRVSLHLRAVDDAALAREIADADLVVLPYEEMHNSGAMLLALSLDRPVLVPRNPVTTSLAQEVGASWVRMFDPPLDATALADALDVPAGPSLPDLSNREWPAIGRQLAQAYTATLTGRAHGRDDRP